MDINTAVRKEDINAIQQDLLNMLKTYKKDPDKVIDVAEKIRTATQPDENLMEPEPETLEEALEANRRLREELSGLKPSRPATEQDIRNLYTDSKSFKESLKKAVSSQSTAWAEQEIPGEAGVANINGRSFRYRLGKKLVGWGKNLLNDPEAVRQNLDIVRQMVSEGIENYYGGWSKISDLVITGGQLIINGEMYVPVIEEGYSPRLPLDVSDHLKGGCIAPLFDYGYLKKMSNLTRFVCDDRDFYEIHVGADLGLGRGIGVSSLFRICRHLTTLTLGRDTVTRAGLYSRESVPIKKKLNITKRFINHMDGYKLNVFAGTNGLQSYMFSNLCNYAVNRGNKGLIRFCCGTMVRAGLAVTSGVLNLGVHVVGSACKTAAGVICEAVRDKRLQ